VNTRIEEISIDKFDLSLSGMRIMNMTRILQVEKSMRLHGQLQPVVARVHEGGYQLIDGFKRFYASEDLMMEGLHRLNLRLQLVLQVPGQNGGPVLAALATPDKDDALAEIHILNAQADTLKQA
jgi:ParB-like chromosome segregation protein Spo0J